MLSVWNGWRTLSERPRNARPSVPSVAMAPEAARQQKGSSLFCASVDSLVTAVSADDAYSSRTTCPHGVFSFSQQRWLREGHPWEIDRHAPNAEGARRDQTYPHGRNK